MTLSRRGILGGVEMEARGRVTARIRGRGMTASNHEHTKQGGDCCEEGSRVMETVELQN